MTDIRSLSRVLIVSRSELFAHRAQVHSLK
nr:MAG TPA: hypothetical protein [Caudoviricetes sp.]